MKQSTLRPLTNSMPVLLSNNRNQYDRLNLYFLSRIEMEYTVKTVLLVLGCLSSFVSMVVSYDMGYIGEFYFTLFDDSNNFTDAKNLCQNNASSSNLISISDDETRDAVGKFLNQSNASSSDFIYIDTMLKKANKRTWYLIYGSKYWGGVDRQNEAQYWLYGYINRDARGSYVRCSRPDQRSYFICQLNMTVCSNSSDDRNVILYQQQCYVKYETENVTWYEARKRCISYGGDLATFNYPSYPSPDYSYNNYSAPFDTSRLILNFSYWFGLRLYNWSWVSPSDGNSETLYDGWSIGKPNNYDYSCVCLDPNGSPKWSWIDCNCSIRRPFLCVKKVPTTTSTTTKATSTSVASPNNNSSQDTTANSSFDKKLIIGLIVGLGGSLLIIVIIVVIIIIIRCRKRNRDVNSTSSSDELQTENHKNQRAGILNNSNINNSLSAEDVDGSQYAAVVVNTPPQKKTESSETHPEILYTSFDHGRNKPSDSDETDGRMASRQARETIYAPSADEVYANARH